jgi:DNA-binding NtrC family response regulator
LDLTEVQKAMVPGADEALKSALSYKQARQAFLLTLIDRALEQCGGEKVTAARKLGITPHMIHAALNGEVLVYSPVKKKKSAEKK